MDDKGMDDFDPDKILDDLMTVHKRYFVDDHYRLPTSRYEAWLMASYLSNMKIAKVLEGIFDELKIFLRKGDIFQNQVENIKIKDDRKDVDQEKQILKRRK